MTNSIHIIYPYRNGTWVFDDEDKGLTREPFVSGMPEIIDAIVDAKKLVGADKGFMMTFSDAPFPGAEGTLELLYPEWGGNWYGYKKMEGWLCPALFKYFPVAPEFIHVRAEKLRPPTMWAKLKKWLRRFKKKPAPALAADYTEWWKDWDKKHSISGTGDGLSYQEQITLEDENALLWQENERLKLEILRLQIRIGEDERDSGLELIR